MKTALAKTRYLSAVVVLALGAAAFAIVFRGLLKWSFEKLTGASDVVTMFEVLPTWQRLALPAAGGLISGLVALRMARTKQGQGVGDVMEAVVLGRTHLSMKTTLLKSMGSWFAIVGGGSIGREGPLIQFGGSLGDWLGDVFRVAPDEERALMAAGTAAGFAAAYNTPFAAVLFVLEVVTGVVALDAIVASVIAAAIATIVTRAAIGGGPIYGARTFDMASSNELIAYVALGLCAALVAQGFMRLLSAGEALFERSRLRQPWRAAAGGLLVGLIAILFPEVTGNGYEPINAILDEKLTWTFVLALLAAKAMATTASVSSGSPGGIFTPTLFIGAALGLCFHRTLELALGPVPLGSPGAYALVGMATTTAATTHAPMMAAVLTFELSGDYAIVVPLLLATAASTLLSRALRADSIYGAELRRRGLSWELTLDGRRVLVDSLRPTARDELPPKTTRPD